jgi:AcrR family transcriptional regulator
MRGSQVVSQPEDGRSPLSRERVLMAAVHLADRAGIDALSMRKLGQELGVDAMALYRHVRNKDDILDGIVEVVVGEIGLPTSGDDWKAALRARVMAARRVMLRHPWAPRVLEERTTMGPAVLGYTESVMAILLDGGFSIGMAHHALHVLGSRILGFTQDLFEDTDEGRPEPEAAASLARALAEKYPRLAELAVAVSHDGRLGPCDDDFEFEFGLDLILDGLDQRRRGPDSGIPA